MPARPWQDLDAFIRDQRERWLSRIREHVPEYDQLPEEEQLRLLRAFVEMNYPNPVRDQDG